MTEKRCGCVRLWVLGCVCIGLLEACQSLPSQDGRTPSVHVSADLPSTLADANAMLVTAHAPMSGVYPLDDGQEAFIARVALARAAEHSLDVQYYIWRNDTSGQLLLHELVRAARRGVRVRLLLDDNNTAGMDNILMALNRVPHFHIRLFNPFVNRHWRALGYLTDFERLNRRMHNKSMTADNQATIVGGRNIGDEYFDIGQGTLFVDLDVLAIGPVVTQVSADFDRYWNSASAYPVRRIITQKHDELQTDAVVYSRRKFSQLRAQAYQDAYEQDDFMQQLLTARLPYVWTPVQLVSDDSAKALPAPKQAPEPVDGHPAENQAVAGNSAASGRKETQSTAALFAGMVPQPQHDLLLVSPYFVPTRAGMSALQTWVQQGVHIRVLTNSLAATDVPAVHSGYVHYRQPLLRDGIDLYELKNQGPVKGRRDRGLTGSSASSLHAKTFTLDGRSLFVGSFNLDPRSVHFNTEMGLLIQSPVLASAVNQAVDAALPQAAYQVKRDAQGRLQWQSQDEDGQIVIQHHEPQAGWWRRLWVRMLSWLPLEPLL